MIDAKQSLIYLSASYIGTITVTFGAIAQLPLASYRHILMTTLPSGLDFDVKFINANCTLCVPVSLTG
jgi:hypothetical protein